MFLRGIQNHQKLVCLQEVAKSVQVFHIDSRFLVFKLDDVLTRCYRMVSHNMSATLKGKIVCSLFQRQRMPNLECRPNLLQFQPFFQLFLVIVGQPRVNELDSCPNQQMVRGSRYKYYCKRTTRNRPGSLCRSCGVPETFYNRVKL